LRNLSISDPHYEFRFNLDIDLPGVPGVYNKEFKLNRLQNSKGENFSLNMTWQVLVKPMEANFIVKKRDFEEIEIKKFKNEYANFELDKLDFTNSSIAIRTYHSIIINTNHLNIVEAFQCEILHIIERKWSGIRIFNKEKLMASSNFIGISQLPIDEQVGPSSSKVGISLEKFEKAMLVKNLNGDYAIVKGKWSGLRKVREIGRYGKPVIKGDPGRLSVTYYLFRSGSVVRFDVPRSFIFNVENEIIRILVNLKTGAINFKFKEYKINIDPLEVESMLAIVLSVSTLHVILQPKERIHNSNQISAANNKIFSKQPISNKSSYHYRPSPYDKFLLLNIIGYQDIMNSTHFRPDLCDDYFLNECENNTVRNINFS